MLKIIAISKSDKTGSWLFQQALLTNIVILSTAASNLSWNFQVLNIEVVEKPNIYHFGFDSVAK